MEKRKVYFVCTPVYPHGAWGGVQADFAPIEGAQLSIKSLAVARQIANDKFLEAGGKKPFVVLEATVAYMPVLGGDDGQHV